eukprot:TRINITY_DN59459_c0_g2_i2.p2 TRINITY_DN59459_c0_g2~~TRINITY_DN59459_c0_g2_i2.p2  ORF type:complete len:119 (+),score=4.67 TRINITY_DN59459_c0_g2_i2:31-387(+)
MRRSLSCPSLLCSAEFAALWGQALAETRHPTASPTSPQKTIRKQSTVVASSPLSMGVPGSPKLARGKSSVALKTTLPDRQAGNRKAKEAEDAGPKLGLSASVGFGVLRGQQAPPRPAQ